MRAHGTERPALVSLVVPIYKNEGSLERLLHELLDLDRRLDHHLEVVFVVDGSPDRSLELLQRRLPALPLRTTLVSLSRNFGSFSAILAGLDAGSGEHFAVLSADLQEPPSLIVDFHEILSAGETDIVLGRRAKRTDPWLSQLAAQIFWRVYRALVLPELPHGGADIFGCTRQVRDVLVRFREVNSNLVALLLWTGFRRRFVAYERAARQDGRSAWTFSKKLRYSVDSVFNFTDLPIRLLLLLGAAGSALATIIGVVVLVAKLRGQVPVPGYTITVLIVLFFGGLTTLGLGIVGQYLWLVLQNVRQRPHYLVAASQHYGHDGAQVDAFGSARYSTSAPPA